MVTAVFLMSRGTDHPEARAAADAPPAGDAPLAVQGVASCATMACHHGGGPKGSWRSEYTTWINHDPHARAYSILFDAPARQIVKTLHGSNARPASETLLCLNCHVQPGLKSLPGEGPGSRPPRSVLADGVGCETCHGPAEKWLDTHYLADWKQKSPADKAALGFRHTKDLVVRAQLCVTCHVGSEDLDVNHKLIAAGHPRLRFDYAAYLANLPKHWDERKDRTGRADFDVQVWEIGQVVSMQAALKLLEHRAATPGKPWPELAEYDCFSCHHVLGDQKWRRQAKYLEQRPPGSFAWGTWYYALTDLLERQPPRPGLKMPEASLKEVRKLMQVPYGDAAQEGVARAAGEAAAQLTGWLPSLRRPAYDWDVRDLESALDAKVQKELERSSWDQATQMYLALAAQRPTGKRKEVMNSLWRELEFPPQLASPRGFDPSRLRPR
jgi:hypothetical protein